MLGSAYEEGAASAEEERLELPPGRNGKLIELDDFTVFADLDNYAPEIIATLESGWYEEWERRLVKEILSPVDRVIEVGTAIGLVAMTAASIVGAANILTFGLRQLTRCRESFDVSSSLANHPEDFLQLRNMSF